MLVVAGGGLLFLGRFRSNRVTVGSAAKITAIVAAAWLVALLAGLPSLLAGYLNTLDLAGFAIYQISLRIRDGLILFSGMFVIAAIVLDPAIAPEENSSGMRRIASLYSNVAFGIVGAIANSQTDLVNGESATREESNLRTRIRSAGAGFGLARPLPQNPRSDSGAGFERPFGHPRLVCFAAVLHHGARSIKALGQRCARTEHVIEPWLRRIDRGGE